MNKLLNLLIHFIDDIKVLLLLTLTINSMDVIDIVLYLYRH